MAAAKTSLIGIGLRAAWSSAYGSEVRTAEPTRSCEDDYRIEPAHGLAVVASGVGVIGAQGRPAAVLAGWSVAGEVVAADPSLPGAERLQAAFHRAHAAVDRLTWSWAARRPVTSAAALLLDGDQAWLAHVGSTRISRISRSGLTPVTADHDLARAIAEDPALAGDGSLAARHDLHRIVTRALGFEAANPEIVRIPVRVGDWFLIASAAVQRILDAAQIADILWPADSRQSPEQRVFELLDALVEAAPHGTVAFAVVGVSDEPPARVAHGGSRRPADSWLFKPGQPLPEPPADWRPETGSHGPDRRWFEQVADPLYAL